MIVGQGCARRSTMVGQWNQFDASSFMPAMVRQVAGGGSPIHG
ncbi:hypothetical protein MMMB2_1511 [Mycobacterium marinum MB2]|nr:hypothetical protein MMMB2_1511 [Mycobacterium marinum MB2]